MKIILAAFTALLLRAQSADGFIHGTILDPAGGVMNRVAVEISSSAFSCKTTSNEEGRFNCRVPQGGYRVHIIDDSLVPYRRATVMIASGAHLFLTLRPLIRGALVAGLPDPRVNYKEEIVGGAEVIIQYASSIPKEHGIIFRAPNLFSVPYLVLTVDQLTVYADELSCSNPILTCTGKGRAMVELGEERIEGTSIELDLSSRRVVVNRDANVVRTF